MPYSNNQTEKGVENEDKETRNPKALVLLVGALVLVTFLALILLLGLCTRGFGDWDNTVCNTRECVRAAARITSYMDESVDPCHDFYQYACGGYEKIHIIEPGSVSVNPWSALSNDLSIKLKSLLESPSEIDHLNVVTQAKNYYRSCMNETYLDELGVRPLKEHIDSKGGWALLDKSWSGTDFDLEDYIVKIGRDSMPSLISARVGPNLNKSDENIIHLGQGMLLLGNREYYLKPKVENSILRAMERMIVQLVTSLGGELDTIRPKVVQLVDFETEVAKLTVPAADRQAVATKLMTIKKVLDEYKGFNALKIINGFLRPLDLNVDEDSVVGVSDDAYLRRIGALIAKTPKETLASYVLMRGLSSLLAYTDKTTRSLRNELKTLTRGAADEKPRYQSCAQKTNSQFSYATARLFVDEHFRDGTDDIKDMTQRLKTVFKDNLKNLEWFDEESREEARAKVDTMRDKLAYPSFIMDNEALEKQSTIDDLLPDEYLANTVKLNRQQVKTSLLNLNKTVDYVEWHMPPVTVNAFYNPPGNMIVFPLGILQPPFYDLKGLKVLNYAGVGEVMGHEITHGFDSNGRLYDKNGNRHQWWTPESVKKFLVLAKCVEEQYSNITIEVLGTKVNGKLTQGENIADIGAIKQSFQAYQNLVSETGAEKTLPGLPIPSNELFFLSYAQMYCHLITPQFLGQLSRDSHTPMKERVFGTLINSEHFSQTFQCPVGSRMNPGARCTVW